MPGPAKSATKRCRSVAGDGLAAGTFGGGKSENKHLGLLSLKERSGKIKIPQDPKVTVFCELAIMGSSSIRSGSHSGGTLVAFAVICLSV